MPTPNMSDEELDSVFRRVANEYSPEVPPPGAWERLEGQLATTVATQQLRGKVLRAFGVEVAVLGLLVWQSAQLLPHINRNNRLAINSSAANAVRQAARASHSVPAATVAVTGPVADSPGAAGSHPATEKAVAAATVTGPTVAPARLATTQNGDLAIAAPATEAATRALSATLVAERAGLGRRRPTAGVASPLASPASAAPGKGKSTRPQVPKHKEASPASAIAAIAVTAGPTLSTASASADVSPALMVAAVIGAARHRQPANEAGHTLPQVAAPGEQGSRLREKTGHLAGNKLRISEKTANGQAFEAKSLLVAGLAEAPVAGHLVRLPLASYPLPDSLGGLVRLLPADTTKEQKPAVPRPPYRLVLGLLGAPSFSAVRTPQTARFGGDYGLTLEYLLTSRLRVRVGLISSRKRYNAASSDYEAPAAWKWPMASYQVNADCRITEIPLDLRFDVLRRPTYALFTSVGVNSLLMRDEQYSYNWTTNGQTFTKSAEVINGSNHFLGVLNLSVGVERPLGGRWSAQVEPFWQIPLGGVGAGKVHLSSAGAAFSLKFGLIR